MIPDRIYKEGFSLFICSPFSNGRLYGFIEINNNVISDLICDSIASLSSRYKISYEDLINMIRSVFSNSYNTTITKYDFVIMEKDPDIMLIKMDSSFNRVIDNVSLKRICDFSDRFNLTKIDTIMIMAEIYKIASKIDNFISSIQEIILTDIMDMIELKQYCEVI
ncbi:MAG: hypothetical protein QXD03_02140 [Candidatus Anstonellales archaeon]